MLSGDDALRSLPEEKDRPHPRLSPSLQKTACQMQPIHLGDKVPRGELGTLSGSPERANKPGVSAVLFHGTQTRQERLGMTRTAALSGVLSTQRTDPTSTAESHAPLAASGRRPTGRSSLRACRPGCLWRRAARRGHGGRFRVLRRGVAGVRTTALLPRHGPGNEPNRGVRTGRSSKSVALTQEVYITPSIR